MEDVQWRAAVLTAVTQCHCIHLVDTYDATTGDPIPSFCFRRKPDEDLRDFMLNTLHTACEVTQMECFSMYVDDELDLRLQNSLTLWETTDEW